MMGCSATSRMDRPADEAGQHGVPLVRPGQRRVHLAGCVGPVASADLDLGQPVRLRQRQPVGGDGPDRHVLLVRHGLRCPGGGEQGLPRHHVGAEFGEDGPVAVLQLRLALHLAGVPQRGQGSEEAGHQGPAQGDADQEEGGGRLPPREEEGQVVRGEGQAGPEPPGDQGEELRQGEAETDRDLAEAGEGEGGQGQGAVGPGPVEAGSESGREVCDPDDEEPGEPGEERRSRGCGGGAGGGSRGGVE